jgi:hypothetical protein
MYNEKCALIASYRAMPETLAARCQGLGANGRYEPGGPSTLTTATPDPERTTTMCDS